MEDLKLTRFEGMPSHIEHCTQANILDYFPGPSLIEIPAGGEDWLLVSVLLHGNEVVGLEVLKRLSERLAHRKPQRNLALFVGNVEACSKEVRHLKDQMDFNRLWGSEPSDKVMPSFARDLLQWASSRKIFASIDIHNNSGRNPFYACITEASQETIYLATLFSHILVFFQTPKTVFTRAFSQFGPSVTIECGEPHNPQSADYALNFVWDILNLSHLEISRMDHQSYQSYHTVGRILVPRGVQFEFEPSRGELTLPSELDHLNFSPIPKGGYFAQALSTKRCLQVFDEDQIDVTDQYFEERNGGLYLVREVVPAMLTLNREIIASDCLGYFMEPIHLLDSSLS